MSSVTFEYTLKKLPVDSPDDSPTWREWVEALRLGFHESRATDHHVEVVRSVVRADQWQRTVAYPVRKTLTPNAMVGTFATTTKKVNVGAGNLVDCSYISEVTVRHSERRQGLLRTMMTQSLRESHAAGIPLAALTASEGAIYGRFGFGTAIWRRKTEIDTRRWRLRPHLTATGSVGTGSIEVIDRRDVAPFAQQIWQHQLQHEMGAFERTEFNRLALGGLDWDSYEADPKARAMVHLDEAGNVDGYALYSWGGNNPDPTVNVAEVLGTSMAAEVALWDGLANLDLVTKLSTFTLGVGHPVTFALQDARAVETSRVQDGMWLRILDVAAALSTRAFAHDGALHLHVVDPLDLASGTYALLVGGDPAQPNNPSRRAQVRRISPQEFGDGAPAITLGVDALAELYLGATSVNQLAGAGRITGTPDAIAQASALFALDTQPRMSADF